jgi:hypothetical protein
LDAPLIGGYRTPLDLDLTGLRAPGEAIEIVVKINDPSTTAYFRTDGLDVSAGDSDSQTHMRRPKLPLGAGTKPTSITFYAIREDTVPALLFNLGILIEDGVYTTPIFIDPKIKNDG